MVETQLQKRDITDKQILHALSNIPRELFVPDEFKDEAYDDNPLPIGYNQTISQPYIVASMTQNLNVNKQHKVLEIGTGCGYQTALLAELAKEVFTIELVEQLSTKTQKLLCELEYQNIHYKIGNGRYGWAEYAPFDRIIVTAASPQVPEQLLHQLSDNGILIIPKGDPDALVQNLVKIEKRNGMVIETSLYAVKFVPLLDEN